MNPIIGGNFVISSLKKVVLLLVIFSGVLVLGGGSDALLIGPPLIVTSLGDGPGSVMLEMVCHRNGIDFKSAAALGAEELEAMIDVSDAPVTLVMVTGSLVDGDMCIVCSAIETDLDDELNRIDKLIEFAKSRGIPIIGVHVTGGIELSDRNSNQAIEAIMPNSNAMILVSAEEHVGIREISETEGILLIRVSDPLDIADALNEIFNAFGSSKVNTF